MSELPPRPPHRIPTDEDYDVAAELVDAQFQAKGGPWVYYHRTALLDLRSKQTTHDVLAVMSTQARLIEPIKDDRFTPVDPRFMATHAFRAGMWTAGFMSEELHRGSLSFGGVCNVIVQSLPHEAPASQEEYEADGRYLMTIGDEGLKKVGYETRQYINRWGEDIVSNENVRRYYALGAGAILYASHSLYTKVYEEMQVSYEAGLLTDELSQFLANTDSSDN